MSPHEAASVSPEPPDIPADTHLLAALRHAPDQGVAPPPGLSAHILAQAQQAVAPAPAAPWLQRWRRGLRALDRLLSQPALTGALATVALATVIGVMWRGGAPVDSGPGLAEANLPATVPAASDPAAREMRAADTAVIAAAPPPPAPATAPPARPTPPVRALKAPAAAQPPQAPMAPPATAAAEPAPAADLARRLESARASNPAAVVVEQASPAPRPLAAVLNALRDQPATVQVLSVPGRNARAETRAGARSEALPDAFRQRPVTDELRAAAKASQPFTDPAAGREWLAGVARAAEGRWQPVAAPAADVGEPGQRVQVDGATAGRLLLTDSGVLWWPGNASGPAWRADLDAATLQILRAQAPRP